MAYFFCKFITPRKDFLKTMSADEAKLLKAHGEYLQGLLEQGSVVAHGPVVEPQGGIRLVLVRGGRRKPTIRADGAGPDDLGWSWSSLRHIPDDPAPVPEKLR